jgi:hypothetical protein
MPSTYMTFYTNTAASIISNACNVEQGASKGTKGSPIVAEDFMVIRSLRLDEQAVTIHVSRLLKAHGRN